MSEISLNFDPSDRVDQWQPSVTDDGVVRCCPTCLHFEPMIEVRDEKTGALRGYTCTHRQRDPSDTALLEPCGGWLKKKYE